ncbi:MAG: hypothetical protein ACRESQ_00365 [Gammaproteobacteria bacterium]
MIISVWQRSVLIAVVILVVLPLPPVTRVLQARMVTQMLVQIPLLIAAGYLLRAALPQRPVTTIAAWNLNGISGLLLATFATAFWMLPRSLDAAATEPLVTLAKFLSVPLLIGLPMALSWPRMNFVVRGVFLVELIAMFFRLGWLYMISPIRLCNNYLLDDQQRSGQYLLMIGGAILLWVAAKLMWGHFDLLQREPQAAPAHQHNASGIRHPAER